MLYLIVVKVVVEILTQHSILCQNKYCLCPPNERPDIATLTFKKGCQEYFTESQNKCNNLRL